MGQGAGLIWGSHTVFHFGPVGVTAFGPAVGRLPQNPPGTSLPHPLHSSTTTSMLDDGRRRTTDDDGRRWTTMDDDGRRRTTTDGRGPWAPGQLKLIIHGLMGPGTHS